MNPLYHLPRRLRINAATCIDDDRLLETAGNKSKSRLGGRQSCPLLEDGIGSLPVGGRAEVLVERDRAASKFRTAFGSAISDNRTGVSPVADGIIIIVGPRRVYKPDPPLAV